MKQLTALRTAACRWSVLMCLAVLLLVPPDAGAQRFSGQLTNFPTHARQLLANQDWGTLLKHTENWNRAQPNNWEVFYYRGFAFAKLGEAKNAITMFERAQQLEGRGDISIVENLAVLYDKEDQLEPAKTTYEQLLALAPNNKRLLVRYVNVMIRLVNRDDSHAPYNEDLYRALQRAYRLNAFVPHIDHWMRFAQFSDEYGDTDTAYTAWREVIKYKPDHLPAWLRIAEIDREMGREESAHRIYTRAHRYFPNSIEILRYLGTRAVEEKKHKLAQEYFRKIIASEENNPAAKATAHIGIADMTPDPREALQDYRRAIELDPSMIIAWEKAIAIMRHTNSPSDVSLMRRRMLDQIRINEREEEPAASEPLNQ